MGIEEALWSSDDEDEDSEMAESHDFADFNRQLDDSSVDFVSSFGGKSKRTVSVSPPKRNSTL